MNFITMPHQLEDKIYLNVLNLIFRENFLALNQFLSKFASRKDAYDSLPQFQKRLFNPEQEWERLQKLQIRFITLKDQEYPPLLKEIAYPPLGLYLKGQALNNDNPRILAVVGTRKMTSYGQLVIEKIVKELANYQFIIVSGLALGVDTLSHRVTLENNGTTLAVLATGLDKIFPSSNLGLSQKITQHGTLISEFPLGTPAIKYHFPWRNRIISGLSKAALVIEAPEKSGALITANFALEQNRDVFAIPGSLFNKNSFGPNNLIKKGAKLISDINDILEEYQIKPSSPLSSHALHFDTEIEKHIYELLESNESLLVDKIIEKVNDKTSEVLIGLASLELKGLIKHLEGDRYSKI
ncbi:MAG: DNA-processing protein DprA [Minisyncoccia bacterium]